MTLVSIAYWTTTGNTQEMAEQIAEGVRAAGGSVWIDFIDELSEEQIQASDVIALGCPAMGEETLDGFFQGYYNRMKPLLSGKNVLLFGSWGWGGGAYLESWKKDAENAGINVIGTFGLKKKPDEEGTAASRRLGEQLARVAE